MDECKENDRSLLAKALNGHYGREDSEYSLKFLLTSRPYHHIRCEFRVLERQRPEIHMDGANEDEVKKISEEINIVIKAKVKEIGARLELTCITHRTYLWVYIVFDVIYDLVGITKRTLKETIRQLLRTVNEAY